MPTSPWSYLGTIRMNEIHTIIDLSKLNKYLTKKKKTKQVRKIPLSLMLANLINILSAHYGITEEQLRSNKHSRPIVYVKQLFCYWLREYYEKDITLGKVANLLGYKEHTMVSYSVNKFREKLISNEQVPKEFEMPGITTQVDYMVIKTKIEQLCF